MQHTSGEDQRAACSPSGGYRGLINFTEEARLLTLYLECSGSGTEDKESQPMPTRPKGIESAAHERRDNADIRNNSHSVVERPWTTTVVRGPTTYRVPGGT